MKTLLRHIRQSLSLQLSLSIMGCTAFIFFVTMAILYYRSSTSVHQWAIDEASQALTNTSLRMEGILNEVEAATDNTDWVVVRNLKPDSLMALSRRILELNPDIAGCSIAMQPFFFPERGEYFSAYSSNEKGHIETEQEGSEYYRYFDMPWYMIPMEQQQACWIDPFHDYDTEEGAYQTEMIASYGKPLVTADGKPVGVIAVDLSQRRLAEILAEDMPYPQSYYLLLGNDNHIIASGKSDATEKDLLRNDCLVLRKAVKRTGWTLCIVCPKHAIFKGYNHLIMIIVAIFVFGLIMILAFCYVVSRRVVSPLQLLVDRTQQMEQGHFDLTLPETSRKDEIGQLQNTFAAMQQSITGYITDLQRVKDETEQRNEELIVAMSQAEEGDRRTTEFIQDLTHQIRTPLNVIGGFAQVLKNDIDLLVDEDIESISKGMLQNSTDIQAIITNLLTISALEDATTIECTDVVACNDICREVMQHVNIRHESTVTMSFETQVPDTLTVTTHRASLRMILRELLENANKFTKVGTITLSCRQLSDNRVEFAVSDTGQGILPEDHERVFTLFTKLSAFSEGLGLGLYLSRRQARLMGGSLEIDASYSGGTRIVYVTP